MPLKSSYPSNIFFNVSRIVVVADIHDDLFRFQNILLDAKVINDKNEWIADRNTVVVQLGDQIDRKSIDNDDIPAKHHFRVVKYTEQLKQSAQNKGGDFVSLIGNHELMNIDKIRKKEDIQYIISHRPIIVLINNYAFCHGGLKLEHYKLLKLYKKTLKDLNEIWYKYVNTIELSNEEIDILNALILDKQDSILYTRQLGDKFDHNKLFRSLDVDYMFVGHSETTNIFLKDRVWYLDQMLRTAFDDKIYNYIDIHHDNITIRSLSSYN
jgi:hypothetical protein